MDSPESRSMILGGYENLFTATRRIKKRMRVVSRCPKRARRQYWDGRFWFVSLLDVFHAKSFVSVLSEEFGKGTRALKLSNVVWDRKDTFR